MSQNQRLSVMYFSFWHPSTPENASPVPDVLGCFSQMLLSKQTAKNRPCLLTHWVDNDWIQMYVTSKIMILSYWYILN